MQKLVPGTLNVFITDTYEFVYDDGTKHPGVTVSGSQVTLFLQGRMRTLDAQFLWLYSCLETPSYICLEDLYFIPLPIRRRSCPWRPMLRRPYYLDPEQKYRIIPEFPTDAVSADGVVLHVDNHQILHQTIGKTGYAYVNVYSAMTGRWRFVGVHQLVAMAWISKHQDSEHFSVNHKNGIRTDNRVENLEWCTPAENATDATERTRRNRTDYAGRVRDVRTGEITEFKTFAELANFVGLNSHQADAFKNARAMRLFGKYYEVRLANDKRPWYYDTHNVLNPSNGNERYVFSVTEPDGKKTVISGVRELREHYGLPAGKTSGPETVVIFKRLYPDYDIQMKDFKWYTRYEALNTVSGERVTCSSRKDICQRIGLPHKVVTRLIISKGTQTANNWRVRELSDSPWPEIVPEPVKKQVAIRVLERFNPDAVPAYYPNLLVAANALQLHSRTVRRHITNPNPKDRYEISYVQMSDENVAHGDNTVNCS